MIRVAPMTVVEMPEFRRQAAGVLSEEEVLGLVTQIAKDPKAGEVVKDAGGIRKIRFAGSGRGKRGGTRAIYVYYSEEVPVFLLSCYPKNRKADLTASEKKLMRKLVPALKAAYEAGLETRIRRARLRERVVHGTQETRTERGAQG